MNTALKPNTAIVVTRKALLDEPNNKQIIGYLKLSHESANIILLDENPDDQAPLPEFEWDVVISNTGKRPRAFFLSNALSVLKEASNLTPVIAIDPEINAPYVFTVDTGVLWLLTGEEFE